MLNKWDYIKLRSLFASKENDGQGTKTAHGEEKIIYQISSGKLLISSHWESLPRKISKQIKK